MKKILCLGVIFVMCLGLFAGCGEKKGDKTVPYNAVVVETDFQFKKDFWKENIISGAINRYYDDEGNLQTVKTFEDETLPNFRIFIVKEQNEFDDIFDVFPQVDFEKEMVIIYIFRTPHSNRTYKIKNVEVCDKTLKISYAELGGKPGYGDASLPQRKALVIKMDKLDVESVEFKEVL